METPQQEHRIRQFFVLSVLLKGAISFIEIVAGVLVYFLPVAALTGYVVTIAQGELLENPTSFIATHVLHIAQSLSLVSPTFMALYLLSRGIIKFALVVALLKDQLWAYPSSLVLLALFMIYQTYQIFTEYSTFLVLLTLFDFVVMYFIWKEYQIVKEHLHMKKATR